MCRHFQFLIDEFYDADWISDGQKYNIYLMQNGLPILNYTNKLKMDEENKNIEMKTSTCSTDRFWDGLWATIN